MAGLPVVEVEGQEQQEHAPVQQVTPVIDLSRFHKGPLTEEQLNKNATILVYCQYSFEICAVSNRKVLDVIGNEVGVSRIKLWYPLQEVK